MGAGADREGTRIGWKLEGDERRSRKAGHSLKEQKKDEKNRGAESTPVFFQAGWGAFGSCQEKASCPTISQMGKIYERLAGSIKVWQSEG